MRDSRLDQVDTCWHQPHRRECTEGHSSVLYVCSILHFLPVWQSRRGEVGRVQYLEDERGVLSLLSLIFTFFGYPEPLTWLTILMNLVLNLSLAKHWVLVTKLWIRKKVWIQPDQIKTQTKTFRNVIDIWDLAVKSFSFCKIPCVLQREASFDIKIFSDIS